MRVLLVPHSRSVSFAERLEEKKREKKRIKETVESTKKRVEN
jgi:hypothetical protein